MKRFSQQFKKQSEHIRMRASERDALRERLVSYMEYHPVASSIAPKKQSRATDGIVSEPFRTIRFNPVYLRSFAGVFAVFFIIGVPLFAERSVPGDVLYPVKVQFNEELRSSLSLSPYAKVVWETERLERRLAEARLLASEGKLTEEAENKVAAAVKNHSEAAQREIAQLRENNSEDAVIAEITFASALDVQSEVLEGHIQKVKEQEGDKKADSSIVALAQVVDQARDSAEAAQSGTQPSYEKLLGWVESESTHIYELFASVEKDASKEEVKDVERRLADIERKIAAATALQEQQPAQEDVVTMMSMTVSDQEMTDTATNTEDGTTTLLSSSSTPETYARAKNVPEEVVSDPKEQSIELLRSALKDIQKLLNYMTHIDVRRNVSVEDLVPLTLTAEEKSAQIMQILDETSALQAEVGTRAVTESMREKVSQGQQDLEAQIRATVAALEAGSLDEARALIDEAYVLAQDLHALTQDEPLKDVPVIEDTQESASTTQEAQAE